MTTSWGACRTIAHELREAITHDRLTVGERLPCERTLADRYAVSRSTIRRALSHLEREHLIMTLHGRGRVVTDPQDRARTVPPRPRYEEIAESLIHEITHGTLLPGRPLPNERTLARRHRTSPAIAARALRELTDQGWAVSRRGGVLVVRPLAQALSFPPDAWSRHGSIGVITERTRRSGKRI